MVSGDNIFNNKVKKKITYWKQKENVIPFIAENVHHAVIKLKQQHLLAAKTKIFLYPP